MSIDEQTLDSHTNIWLLIHVDFYVNVCHFTYKMHKTIYLMCTVVVIMN